MQSDIQFTSRPCVFLDRDGTITREAGYINHPERIELLPGAAAAVRRLNQAGIITVVTTNQAGVAKGIFDEAVMLAVMDRMVALLAARGARLDAVYAAPFHSGAKDPRWRDDPEELRKPGLGMIRKAQRELPIDMTRSYVVGDKHTDVAFAHAAGLPAVMVMSGYGLGEYTYKRALWPRQPEAVADTLTQAVNWIMKDLRQIEKRAKIEGRSAKKMPDNLQPSKTPFVASEIPRHLPTPPAARVTSRAEAAAYARAAQAQGKQVVFANGCFDLLHGGHVSYLNDARAQGDVLIVGLNSDASVRALKGDGQPYMPDAERAELIAGMEAVDRVVVFEEATAEACLREIHPDVHAKGTDYSAETVPERAIAEELGIRVAITGAPKQNSSKIIKRQIRERGTGA